MTDIFVWTKYDTHDEHHLTGHTAKTIEEYDWRNPQYFELFMYFFADEDGNLVDVPAAEVDEATQAEINELTDWLYSQSWGTVGGPLHIITDDNNLEDQHLDFCLVEIDRDNYPSTTPQSEEDKAKCRRLIELLRVLTYGARHVALRTAEAVPGSSY